MNRDYRNLAFVGWETTSNNWTYQYFFSEENIKMLSKTITHLLKSGGQTINVADNVIAGVMSNVAANFNPRTGDIYTRYTITSSSPRDDLQNMNDQVVTVIVNTIRGEQDQQLCNSRLNIWNTVFGTFNSEGLRAHSAIKTKENDYMKGMFSMNY